MRLPPELLPGDLYIQSVRFSGETYRVILILACNTYALDTYDVLVARRAVPRQNDSAMIHDTSHFHMSHHVLANMADHKYWRIQLIRDGELKEIGRDHGRFG